jgi:tripartite-type tricarboxylate transporter receptor subunit TctC
MRRRLLGLNFLIVATCLAASAMAEDYPSRMVEIVVPYPPGSSVDSTARLIAEKLHDRWGQSVIVENRGGAAGNIGAAYVARAKPDGYTLLFTPPAPLAINKSLYHKLSYDPDQFVSISIATNSPSALVVNPQMPVHSVQELIAYAKAHPGDVTYASSGAGGTTHLSSALFASMAGLDMVHVPYTGSGAALNDVMAGHVDMMMSEVGLLLPFIRSGKVRVLAVGSAKRNPALPDTPALGEILPGYVSISWQALAAPAGTPRPVIKKIAAAMADVMKTPDITRHLASISVEPIGGTPAQMDAFLKEERKRWAKVIQISGARAD